MANIWNISGFVPVVAAVLTFTLVAGASGGQGESERQRLLDRQKTLEDRIDKLKREQDFLLFQKAAYDLESKYLIIDLKQKTVQLKYKNRILKHIRILSASSVRALRQGAVTLTGKGYGSDRKALMFGSVLLIQAKGAPTARSKTKTARISIGRKDLVSLFHAMETESRAYIIL